MAFPDFSVIAVVVLFMAIALCWFIVPPRPAAFAGPPKFVVWYRTPLGDKLEYLAFMPPYDQGRGQIRLTLAGVRFSRNGRQIEHGV